MTLPVVLISEEEIQTRVNELAEQISADLDRVEGAFEATLGYRPGLFRPPYGRRSAQSNATLRERGYTQVLWNITPEANARTAAAFEDLKDLRAFLLSIGMTFEFDQELLALLLAAFVAILLVLSNQSGLLYVLALVSTGGLVLILGSINVVLGLILLRRDGRVASWGETAVPLLLLVVAAEVAEGVFSLPTRLGRPRGISGLTDVVNNPMYATGVGLVMFGARMAPEKKFRIRDRNI